MVASFVLCRARRRRQGTLEGLSALHHFQNRAAPLGDAPSSFQPLDEPLGENLQIRYSRRKALRQFGPLLSAGGENGHVTLQVFEACEAIRVARQNLENRDFAELVNPNNPPLAEAEVREAQDAARAFGLELHILNASSESEINAALPSLDHLRAGALLVGTDPFFFSRREQILAEVARHSIAAMYFTREYPAAGGLMSYGGSLTDTYRQAGIYTGRILKGEKPADLP